MQSLILLTISSLILLTRAAPMVDPYAEDMKEREKMGLNCLQEVKIDREVIDRVLATEDLPKDNQKYKDFLACSYKKQGFQSDNGKIQFSSINEFLSRFYSRNDLKILDSCKNVTGKNDGELAFNTLECIMRNLRSLDAF